MKRVGVLGGTFDPPHLGHLRAGEVARVALSLEKVLFVPAADPPHKQDQRITDAQHRLRMLELAIEGVEGFELSRLEVDRRGPSYTIDTMEALSSQLPDARFYFIMGSDAFREIRTWRLWESFLSSTSIVIHERPGDEDGPHQLLSDVLSDRPELRERFVEVPRDEPVTREEGIFVLHSPMVSVSSTELRRSRSRGGSIRFLVPDEVAAYVDEHHLYEKEGSQL